MILGKRQDFKVEKFISLATPKSRTTRRPRQPLPLLKPKHNPARYSNMSSSASRGGERMVQQDYIARIRYSNALPPPPNPPKLLEIPNTGLASGQYTTPGYASRLARDQPLNIEADAELGMPLDLVGMPGIFDGDESYAFPDAGGYVTVKFLTNPVPPSTTYDVRVENSMLVPIDPPEEEQAAKQAAQEAHNADPEHNPPPENTLEYELFMPETVDAALNYKRKFDILDNDHQEEDLYTDKQGNGEGCFRFKRVRAYESATSAGTYEEKYDDEVIIALHDGKDGRLQKGAYYYPIVQRISIRPQRQKNIDKRMGRMQSQQEEVTDYMDMRIEDPDAEVIATRTVFRDYPYGESEKLEAEKLEAERLADAASPTED
ncbi:putative RNA polymerase II-associated protein 1 like protein [Glarea lozoyensis 74030]|uniref:Putative RNA polymerase II-associated protein 1 like protein n=1 Tax=Glarea lozoyensis (strain ATCC 74030 / MF5533) TaxID=1104152 RepID=H0ESY5_GLAL7|nr:putative RNA polymerase II-associated protein 1 like protein [Glarea lozoyensis 74030]